MDTEQTSKTTVEPLVKEKNGSIVKDVEELEIDVVDFKDLFS